MKQFHGMTTGFHEVHEDPVESTKKLHGLHETLFHGFQGLYLWTPHKLSVDSKGQPPLFNLLKRNHRQKQMLAAGVRLRTFQ